MSVAPLPIDVRTRYDRFPATIKGTFVLRGADGLPHRVLFESAAVERIPTGQQRPMATGASIVDVAPGRDLFVPFETSIVDLEPSWYAVRAHLVVDAEGRSIPFTSKPFCVGWPRGDIRRGSFRLAARVGTGVRAFLIERVDLGPEAASVVWSESHPHGEEADDPDETVAVLFADGHPLEELPADALKPGPMALGERRTISYPVARAVASLAVAIRPPTGTPSPRVDIPLP